MNPRFPLASIACSLPRGHSFNFNYLIITCAGCLPACLSSQVISKQVLASVRAGMRSQYHVYFVPHRTVVCEQMLSDDGALQHIRVGEFRLGLIPFDADLLSLEMDGVFKQVSQPTS